MCVCVCALSLRCGAPAHKRKWKHGNQKLFAQVGFWLRKLSRFLLRACFSTGETQIQPERLVFGHPISVA